MNRTNFIWKHSSLFRLHFTCRSGLMASKSYNYGPSGICIVYQLVCWEKFQISLSWIWSIYWKQIYANRTSFLWAENILGVAQMYLVYIIGHRKMVNTFYMQCMKVKNNMMPSEAILCTFCSWILWYTRAGQLIACDSHAHLVSKAWG